MCKRAIHYKGDEKVVVIRGFVYMGHGSQEGQSSENGSPRTEKLRSRRGLTINQRWNQGFHALPKSNIGEENDLN